MAKRETTEQVDELQARADEIAAANAAEDAEDEWREVRTGLGVEWDFDVTPELVGTYLGPATVALPAPRKGDGATEARAFEFSTPNGELVFAWASYKLEQAFTEIGAGDRVKVVYQGTIAIADGAQQMRQYRVFVAERAKRPAEDFGDEPAF